MDCYDGFDEIEPIPNYQLLIKTFNILAARAHVTLTSENKLFDEQDFMLVYVISVLGKTIDNHVKWLN